MNRLIVALVVLTLIGAPASADFYFTAVGDPEEGGSFYQTFATRAGEWETFNKMKIEITSNWSFEQTEGKILPKPDLSNFYLAPGTANGPGSARLDLDPSWTLSVDNPSVAVAGGAAIGGDPPNQVWNWLVFTANFAGSSLPTQGNKLDFTATLYTTDGGSWLHDMTYFVNYDSNGRKKAEVVTNSVQHFPCSEAGPVIPAPAAIVLGVIGLGLLGYIMRRVA